MKKKFSTLWRFLLPVMVLLVAGTAMLSKQQTSQQLENIETAARVQAKTLIRILNVTDELVGEQVYASMHLLKERGLQLGMPAISGTTRVGGRIVPRLMLGDLPQSNRFQLVDGVTDILGGTATLFVKDGNDFVRIITNVRQKNGERAVGTLLDPKGKAIAALRDGRSFHGEVDILGAPYITRYEPMRDLHGQVIGAWYVGYKVDMKVLREAVENTRYLEAGFAAVMDDRQKIRFLSSHMSPAVADHLLRQPSDDWMIVREDIPNWGFSVMIGYPMSEARAIGLTKSLFAILSGTVLTILLIAVILWQMRRLILNPIGSDPALAIEVVQRIAAGNLELDDLQAPKGTLMANVLRMRSKLGEMLDTLRQNAERMGLSASVFEHTRDGIFIADTATRIIEINPAFSLITGYGREEALGRTPAELGFASAEPHFFAHIWQSPDAVGEWRGESWSRRKTGDSYPAWLELFIVKKEDGLANYVGVFSDITLAKAQQQNLEHMAYHDALTQLPNRTLLDDRLHQAVARANRSGEILAVCYFDLDGFKPINDNFGHDAGDQLLVELAQRVRNCLRESDTVARLGGDEFALLLCNLQSIEECEQTLTRLVVAIKAPFQLVEKTVQISASIGYTLFPMDDSEPDTLLRHADHAMYQAKVSGGSRFHLFDTEHNRQTRDRRQERARIETALPNGEFRLFYQPKVNMRHGRVVGAEALIRWEHPETGLRSPAEFLPLVEDTDFVIPLGEWVIRETLRQISAWRKSGLELQVSVNIAPRHMMQKNFAARLAELLQEYPDVSPALLELEITETAAIEDIAGVAQMINSCKLLGVTFALDDFGVGYSSLTYMRRLPVEVIKIDQSFVRDMLHDADDLAVVAGVISLSREFQRQVVAEGVETADHGLNLLRMGCTIAQGYGIARPMPADVIPAWVESYMPDASWDEGSL
ncbi:diguanylate cyclase [Methylobacillus sp. MM3]|nr:diguanylate cyclase [Methylobacillus sp. MM3]